MLCLLRKIYPRGNPLAACDILGAGPSAIYFVCRTYSHMNQLVHMCHKGNLVSQRGFGPPTCGLGNRYSVQLSYWDMLKLVAVLRVSTPLSPQRAASKPISTGNPISLGKFPFMSGNQFYAPARTKYLSIKPLKLAGYPSAALGIPDRQSSVIAVSPIPHK